MDAQSERTVRAAVPTRQSGATAVEFALVLPLLIALTYSLFVYSYVFVVYESINYAAQQGAQSAVAVDPDIDDYFATVQTYAQTTVAGALSWMPAGQRANSIGEGGSAVQVLPCSAGGSGGSQYCPTAMTGGTPIVVQINFPLLAPNLFPVLNLPGIGTVPPLPASLVGVGVTLLTGEI